MSDLSLETPLFNETLSASGISAPVGLRHVRPPRRIGRRRRRKGHSVHPFHRLRLRPIEEVAPTIKRPITPALCTGA